MEEPIPPGWRNTVCQILETGTLGQEIVTTVRIFTDWQDAFPAAFLSDLVEAMKAALTGQTVLGKRIDTMGSGITYEFYFYCENREGDSRKLCGKISLEPDRNHIRIVAAQPSHSDQP